MAQYREYTDNIDTFRDGVRNHSFVIDKVLTATGFAGTEGTDWQNIETFSKALYFAVTGQTDATTGTFVFCATEDVNVKAIGDVAISIARADEDIYRRHYCTITCAGGNSGHVIISDGSKVVSYGNHNGASEPSLDFYSGADATAPILAWNLNAMPNTVQKIRQASDYATILPATGTAALPTDLVFIRINHGEYDWVSTSPMPSGMEDLRMTEVSKVEWTMEGDFPSGMTTIRMTHGTFNISTTEPIPASVTTVSLYAHGIEIISDSLVPAGVTHVYLRGNALDLTGLDLSGTEDITGLTLYKFRQVALTGSELLTMLESISGRVGNIPAHIEIRDYGEDPTSTAIRDATANVAGTLTEQLRYAVDQVFAKENCSSIRIGATTITQE